ncbi:MAG: type I-C CRISPR-associated protein Cas7/Csd2 [Paludibacteraceae bacterium]|jgi:CRISPR-associated protein Csd2|nr:type I-C CRISPR-associated protein Cas7/Csd2 [Paludibacteraceae bacterium]
MENYIKNRYDFVFIYDVKDGNPNGDPDMDNQPRIDFETREGLVSDVCIKRKVRNYIQLKVEAGELNASKYDIFIRQGNILNNIIGEEAKKAGNDEKKGRVSMCDKYYDIRTFGAVLSTGEKLSNDEADSSESEEKKNKKEKGKGNKKGLGVVRGPVQFVFSRSIDPIDTKTHSLTRCCITKEEDADKDNTFGNKSTVSYGLYRMHGYVSAFDGEKCHFTEEDLKLLWEALANAFEHDHAAARGEMNARALVVFKHNSKLGNARSAQLFELVKIAKKDGVEYPRQFEDYEVKIDKGGVPAGVTLEEMI